MKTVRRKPDNQVLAGVAAVSATREWAVGSHYDGDAGRMRTLVTRWNGEFLRSCRAAIAAVGT